MLLQAALLVAIEPPNLHSAIMLDAKFYTEGNSNSGSYDSSNRFQVRKAAVELEGDLDEKIEYSVEFGVSTCTGTGINLKLMDASIMYRLNENFGLGFKQGHVLRGFASSTECTDRLTMEKPLFLPTFATCHPTGIVAEYYHEFGASSSLITEIALMNGANGTLDGEHDYNLGAIYHTPLDGLAFAGSYNLTAANYYDPLTAMSYSEDGYRSLLGINYDNYNISATAEYMMGKGFSNDKTEMIAAYAQAAYAIPINLGQVRYIQPLVLFEYWDKDSATDADSEYSYLNAGLNISIGDHSKLKFNYKMPQQKAAGTPEQESSLIARLQMSF
jgi:hypothetical protein